jgi:hypothetical protein
MINRLTKEKCKDTLRGHGYQNRKNRQIIRMV